MIQRFITRFLPRIGSWLCRQTTMHDWRYASTYRIPGGESRARCQRCEERQWKPTTL